MISTLRSRTSEKQKAEDATKLKDQFVSLVAHDLRSPFNAILGFLKIAYRDNESPLAPQHKELVGKAITNGELLVKTIDHLLDITRLQTGKIPVEPRFIHIRGLVQEVIGQHSALAEKKGITFINTLPEQLKVYGDPVLAGEVFGNLFSNSVKFCKGGDAITISALENDSTTITVRDTGVGIPKFALPDIFKHEVKTTSLGTGGEKGTGLGLPFCADIMSALGGEITAQSEQGWGTIFMIRFPIVEPIGLIAIQEPSTRQRVTDALRQSGIRVIEAFTPEDAGRMAVEMRPHIMVIDVDGENSEGVEILKKIRSDERTAKLRVLAIASTDDIKAKTAMLGLKVAGIADNKMGTDEALKKILRLM
jgi:CheY-like chemotaxis protein